MIKTREESCCGIGDEAFDSEGVVKGVVGFHDYDNFLVVSKLRNLTDSLAFMMNVPVVCLDTRNGYHFISFAILDPEQDMKWKMLCREIFPSNYLDDICNSCGEKMELLPTMKNQFGVGLLGCRKCGIFKPVTDRILRIGAKNGRKPNFRYSVFPPNFNGQISGGHIEAYEQAIGLPTDVFQKYEIVQTSVKLCEYVTTIVEKDGGD